MKRNRAFGPLCVAAAALSTAVAAGAFHAAAAAVAANAKTDAKTGDAWVRPGVAHPGADQIYWVPTFAQAEQMAKATGRPIVAVGHVSGWNGY